MIFSDINYVFLVFLPFCFVAVFDHYFPAYNVVKSYVIIALSVVYYYYGPAADIVIFAIFVLGNYLILRLAGENRQLILLLASLNVFALFAIKATFPNGAPLAISFIAFQIVGLMITQLRTGGELPTIKAYLFFLVFFPQMVAGPILHWNWVKGFLRRWEQGVVIRPAVEYALLFLAAGLSKKVLIADRLQPPVNMLQSTDTVVGLVDAVIFPFMYAMYLYFDFSAYSDIAVGTAALIGLRLPINFYSPYKARNPSVFWRRWHRTLHKFLSNDLRYIYNYFNLPKKMWFVLFIFLFSGFWHGAGLGFFLWAVGHFFYFVFYPKKIFRKLPLVLSVGLNFVIVSLLWIPFALDANGLLRWLKGVLAIFDGIFLSEGWYYNSLTNIVDLKVVIIGILIVFIMPNSFELARSSKYWFAKRLLIILGLFLPISLMLAGVEAPRAFTYFQF